MQSHNDPKIPPSQELSSLISQFSEEVPAASPVFEGHLYLRTEKKQWQWRLFRFDGSSFTCLSTRKVKLPPNTAVDGPSDPNLQLSFLQASPPTSFTSPLLATPKKQPHIRLTSKSNQLKNQSQDPERVMASYYQLPKFTIDIANISAVSMLKRPSKTNNNSNKNNSQGFYSAITIAPAPSKCFCVRTFDGQCFVMKAQKQKDLERWLFVLTKMWNFVQADILQTPHSQPSCQINQTEPSQYDQRYRMPILSFEKTHWIEEWRKSLAELIAYDPNIKVSPPPIESIPDDDRMSVYSDMTSVSNRNQQTTYAYGKPSGLPSRRRTPTISSKRSNRSLQKLPTAVELEMPLQQRTRSSLRKKRSDDVKNWIEPAKRMERPTVAHPNTTPTDPSILRRNLSVQSASRSVRTSSMRKPMIQRLSTNFNPGRVSSSPEIYHIDFFQDTMTVDTDAQLDVNNDEQDKRLPTVRYHPSVRGKAVHIVNQDRQSQFLLRGAEEEKEEKDTRNSQSTSRRRSSVPLEVEMQLSLHPHHHHSFGDERLSTISPLQNLANVENGLSFKRRRERTPSGNPATPPPLMSPWTSDLTVDQDEEVCLADIQKSLQQTHLNDGWQHTRSPSASSILDLQKQQNYMYGTPIMPYPQSCYPPPSPSPAMVNNAATNNNQSYQNFPFVSPIVAPAIPPVQIIRPTTITSPTCFSYERPFLQDKYNDKDNLEPIMSRSSRSSTNRNTSSRKGYEPPGVDAQHGNYSNQNQKRESWAMKTWTTPDFQHPTSAATATIGGTNARPQSMAPEDYYVKKSRPRSWMIPSRSALTEKFPERLEPSDVIVTGRRSMDLITEGRKGKRWG
ncbi:hypothetical protein J3Q64DRAFT_1704515 [Phycomyces blakesleeanus]|uniref:PH domain-containing protein n=2 Tax=Phycomyces blakesleeanus TaxID=4837 RepID=A0A162TUR2_PHYB8|nr:hypothetical protein PHYBLDRAFT_171998 [Phycomyces blakesleeanus NRRL 1555(-)]OAD69983.1 hypothetical protein PHYBLDRAFT_171998 [Phycomyces blakesleeanus NRRL 1555(-)]|eukprot:XP_018288023.1 hypothetical protein PHYBLDRAFT_171998 [Phycomyces blakesleeanus NRRL 1555(-)]